MFDQFEEVFTLDPVDVAVKAAFFAQLGELLRDRGVWAVIAMREDYIAHLDPYLKVFPRRLATRRRLDFLDERSALAAVRNARPRDGCGVHRGRRPAAGGRSAYGDGDQRRRTDAGTGPACRAGATPSGVQSAVVASARRVPPHVTTADIEQYADTDNALAQLLRRPGRGGRGGNRRVRTDDPRLVRTAPHHPARVPGASVRISR